MVVFVSDFRSGLLASVVGVLVLGVQVCMRVDGPVAVTMLVLVLDVFVGVGMRDSAWMLMLVSVLLTWWC